MTVLLLLAVAAVTVLLALFANQVMDFLGSAAFSQAVQALDTATGALVCLKIIKNNKVGRPGVEPYTMLIVERGTLCCGPALFVDCPVCGERGMFSIFCVHALLAHGRRQTQQRKVPDNRTML